MNAVVHVCDEWTWPQMIRHVKRVTTPTSPNPAHKASPWEHRYSCSPHTSTTPTPSSTTTPTAPPTNREPVLGNAMALTYGHLADHQPSDSESERIPPLQVHQVAPLAQAPAPHYQATQAAAAALQLQLQQLQQQQQQMQVQQQQHVQIQQAQHIAQQQAQQSQQAIQQYAPHRDRASGGSNELQHPYQTAPRGAQPQRGPATYPNNITPLYDQQGTRIGPCPTCTKPHRGRCWKCRDHSFLSSCACSIPRVCLRCGLVNHTAEFCQVAPGAAPPAALPALFPTPPPSHPTPSAPAPLLPAPAAVIDQVVALQRRIDAIEAEEARARARPGPAVPLHPIPPLNPQPRVAAAVTTTTPTTPAAPPATPPNYTTIPP
eukprot:GHVU01093814.1.p1 GENE.GHVU01093814.1~~GHVU01093814.1.p1  ORF type:complete len:389 (+),score=58.59 GHVU01093814.1:43-1167(+)